MDQTAKSEADHSPANSDFRTKVVTVERLLRRLSELRHASHDSPRARIVQCHGCFDIVHPGHIRYLQFAKSQGDVLVVSITGDSEIQKGTQRPYIPEELRAENLAALAFVDFVVIDHQPTAVELLERIQPDVYVKGREYATSDDPRFLAERAAVESAGGRVVFSSGDVVFSSTRILESLESDAELQRDRLALVCRRHGINRPAITSTFSAAAGRRVVVVGDLFLDRYVFCDDGGMSNESPMMSLRELDRRDFIGGAGFVAAQLAALGAKPRLVTAVGDDEQSAWAVGELRRVGVEVIAVESRSDLPVRCRYVVDTQKVFRVDCGRTTPPDSLNERVAIDEVARASDGAEAMLIHDSGYGFLSPGLMKFISGEVISTLGFSAGGFRDGRSGRDLIRGLGLICCSERQLRATMNDRESSLSTLAYQLLESTQTQSAIVTVGKRGLVTFDRPTTDRTSNVWRGRLQSEYFDSFAGHVIDRLGAGDALLAASTICAASGANLMQAAYVGGLAASIAVGRVGPVCVGGDELRRTMASRVELGALSVESSAAGVRRQTGRSHESVIV